MADERSEAQLAGAATWAGGATSENTDREASWRRSSIDSKLQRTTSIAAARDAPTTGAAVATRRVEFGRDDASRSLAEPPPAGTRRAFDPPLAVEVSNLSLWVRPAFGGGTKPRAPFGVPFGARAPGARRGDARSAGTHQHIPQLDVEKAEGTVRGGRALPLGDEGGEGSEERRKRNDTRTDGMVRVLRGVSFEAFPGETTAILGPSGSGKTSLVTAIAGRLSARRGEYKLEGDVLFHKQNEPLFISSSDDATASASSPSPTNKRSNTFGSDKSLPRRVGFVTQDDCMFPSLTVQETVRYAAALRLPDDVTIRNKNARRQKKIDAADAVLEALSLGRAKDVPVGGAFAFPGRGVSGGERKRVAVAVELLTEPSVLILDEPTSGLDATVALRLVRTLANLAKGGTTCFTQSSDDEARGDSPELRLDDRRTVILTIHQPSSRVVKAFDVSLFLARGRRAFYGDVHGIQKYFASMNVFQDFGTNPAEFCVDVCNGEIFEYVGKGERLESRGADDGSFSSFMLTSTDDVDRVVDTVAARSAACAGRVARDGTVGERSAKDAKKDAEIPIGSESAAALRTKETTLSSPPRFAVSWCSSTRVMLRRSLASRRGSLFDVLKMAQVVVVALLVGFLWFQRGARVGVAAVGDVAGVLFFELLFLSFLTLFGSLFTFPDERAVICKERQSGAIRVSAYFVARALADVPLDLFPPTLFVPIVYWLAGLRQNAGAFFQHLMLVYLAVLVSSSLGLFVGSVFPVTKQAQTVASVVMLSVMLTGGFYFDETPRWLNWTKKTSFVNHAYAALLKIQFPNGGTFECFEDEANKLDEHGGERLESSSIKDGNQTTDSSGGNRDSGLGNVQNRIATTCRVRDTAQLEFVDLRESVWVNVVALLCVFLALRLATYLALRFVTLKPR